MNVYEGDLSAGSTEAKALTHLKGDPVRFLSVSKGGLLAFGYAGELYTLTPGGEPQRISVRTKDRESDEQLHLSMSRSLGSSAVSPDGKQIAFLSRGDIFVTSAGHSTTKQVTHGSFTGRGMTFGADNRTLPLRRRALGNSIGHASDVVRIPTSPMQRISSRRSSPSG